MSLFTAQTSRDGDQLKHDCKSALVLTLSQEPMVRETAGGDPFVVFVGTQKGLDQPSVAVLRLPREMEQGERREALDNELRALGGGDQLSLAGQWVRHSWTNPDKTPQESWSFETKAFARGEFSLEQMLSRELPEVEAKSLDASPKRQPVPGLSQLSR